MIERLTKFLTHSLRSVFTRRADQSVLPDTIVITFPEMDALMDGIPFENHPSTAQRCASQWRFLADAVLSAPLGNCTDRDKNEISNLALRMRLIADAVCQTYFENGVVVKRVPEQAWSDVVYGAAIILQARDNYRPLLPRAEPPVGDNVVPFRKPITKTGFGAAASKTPQPIPEGIQSAIRRHDALDMFSASLAAHVRHIIQSQIDVNLHNFGAIPAATLRKTL